MPKSSLYQMTDQALGGTLGQLLTTHKSEGSSLDAVMRDLARRGDVIVSKQTLANWMAKLPEEAAS